MLLFNEHIYSIIYYGSSPNFRTMEIELIIKYLGMWGVGGGLSYYCKDPNPSSSYQQKVVVASESRIPVMNDVDNLLIITKRPNPGDIG